MMRFTSGIFTPGRMSRLICCVQADWLTVIEQRRKVVAHLDDNPSLRAVLPMAFATAYGYALIEAERETGLPESTFPVAAPYSIDQVLDEGFWPGA